MRSEGERYMRRAVLCEQKAKYKCAITMYKKVIGLDPTHAIAYHRLGYLYQLLNDYEHAEEAYLKAIDIDHGLINAYVNLGALYFYEGWIRRAQLILEDALKVDDSSDFLYHIHMNLGRVLHERKEIDGAIEHFQKAAEIEPQEPMPQYNLAAIEFEKGNSEETVKLLNKLLEGDERYVDAYELLAIIYEEEGKEEEAMRCWKKRADYGKVSDAKTRKARKRYRSLLLKEKKKV